MDVGYIWCSAGKYTWSHKLFAIFINDFPNVVKDRSQTALYADDSKVYIIHDNNKDTCTFLFIYFEFYLVVNSLVNYLSSVDYCYRYFSNASMHPVHSQTGANLQLSAQHRVTPHTVCQSETAYEYSSKIRTLLKFIGFVY